MNIPSQMRGALGIIGKMVPKKPEIKKIIAMINPMMDMSSNAGI